MVVKVCGINHTENLKNIVNLDIDMIGLNFYPKSLRYIVDNFISEIPFPSHLKKVGVFVNEKIEHIKRIKEIYKIDYIQCHGHESIEYCEKVKSFSKVIKVFNIGNKENFNATKDFDFCDYFLFDTKTKNFGGSGIQFNWNMLQDYDGQVPFLLAGGIGPQDILKIQTINHSMLAGVDINSKFENRPGIKDIEKVNHFITQIKKQQDVSER